MINQLIVVNVVLIQRSLINSLTHARHTIIDFTCRSRITWCKNLPEEMPWVCNKKIACLRAYSQNKGFYKRW